MEWKKLENENDLDELKSLSDSKFCLIFKYSTRCASSSVTLDRLQRSWNNEEMSHVQPFFLDLINYRRLSDKISDEYGVVHESPQVLLIRNGRSIYHSSHFWINYNEIRDQVSTLALKNGN